MKIWPGSWNQGGGKEPVMETGIRAVERRMRLNRLSLGGGEVDKVKNSVLA